MAQIHIALIGLLAISGALAQVPSYTVTYTSYSESITTLLETSTTSTHCKLISGLIDVGKVAGLTAAQNTTYYQFLNTLETTVINNSSITNETVKLFYVAKVIAEFNITQPQIFTQINQYNITGWSTVSNFISITNSYNLQTSLNLIVSTDSTGSTEFYNQIVAALSAGGYTTELTAFEAFWSTEVKSIIRQSRNRSSGPRSMPSSSTSSSISTTPTIQSSINSTLAPMAASTSSSRMPLPTTKTNKCPASSLVTSLRASC